MKYNHIYVEPPFWVASNEEENTVKQLCVELEEYLNPLHSTGAPDWNNFVQRCRAHWPLASEITIERYPIVLEVPTDGLPVVPASSKVSLKNLTTSPELLDVTAVHHLKDALQQS